VAVVARDVTTWRLEEEQFRLAIESNPLGIVIIDGSGIIHALNGTTERMFGWPRQELMGQPVEVLMPASQRERHARRRADFVSARSPRCRVEQFDVVALRRDGSGFPADVALTAVETRRGPMIMACVTDMTEQRVAAAREEQRRRELQRSNDELAQFAYAASHDLQEPLRMVASYTQLLLERYQGTLDERADKYLRYAAEGATRMQHLVSDLLSISRVDSQARPLATVDSSAVLRRVLADMSARITATGAVVDTGLLPLVRADEVQLGQVFQNLVGNALKFVADRPPRIVIGATADAGMWRFAVADNGIGIAPEYAGRVFEMFQRLHARREYEGNGIGLALVKKIVERHHGRIWLDSTPGEGTTFYFTLTAA
jgi:PAS domain S-box-containing protein